RFRACVEWPGYERRKPLRIDESRQVVGPRTSDLGPRTSDVGPLQRVRAAGTAAARDRALANRAVVVAQFLAAADDAGGADPDRLVDDLEPAVRCAGVVDEPRDVPAHVRVAAPHAVDAEDPDAALLQVLLFARVELFAVADELAGVVDDARALRDRFGGEHALPVHGRVAADDTVKPASRGHDRIVPRSLTRREQEAVSLAHDRQRGVAARRDRDLVERDIFVACAHDHLVLAGGQLDAVVARLALTDGSAGRGIDGVRKPRQRRGDERARQRRAVGRSVVIAAGAAR